MFLSLWFSKEEWVVCRVFKKSQIVKMRHPHDSPEMDSPCNEAHASLGELREIDVSSMLAGFPPAGANASGDNFGHRNDMGAYMNWLVGGDALFGNAMAKVDMECEQPPQLEMHESTWRTF